MMPQKHTFTDEEQVCLDRCFGYKQYCTMRGRFESGVCTFCEFDTALNKILYKDDHWIVWENAFANNRPNKVMLVIASKAHLRSLKDIPKETWAAFHDCIQWAEESYDLPGGGLLMRFGDMRLNAGTVPHLHWNILVPNGEGPIKPILYNTEEEMKMNKERASEYAKRYEAGESPE